MSYDEIEFIWWSLKTSKSEADFWTIFSLPSCPTCHQNQPAGRSFSWDLKEPHEGGARSCGTQGAEGWEPGRVIKMARERKRRGGEMERTGRRGTEAAKRMPILKTCMVK